jgi:hypothetical protein
VARAVIRKYLASCLRRVLAQRSDGADLSKELNWDGMSLSCRALALIEGQSRHVIATDWLDGSLDRNGSRPEHVH